jgi:chromate transporter
MNKLLSLTLVFAMLSILAVGGGTALLPEMQRVLVHQYHWITDRQFRDIYSLGQVAPGPNMLMVMVIGYRLDGMLGAVVVAVAFFLPDCVMTFFANRLWQRYSGSPWRVAIQRGMAPIAIGLMLSGTYTVGALSLRKTPAPILGASIALVTLAILSWRRVNPVLLISAAGAIYLAATQW